jgi:hypothetical protein
MNDEALPRLFIGWSGEPSRTVASALNKWIPIVLPGVEAWMSEEAIVPGYRWSEKLSDILLTSRFGIVCVTAVNQSSSWLNFEAGILAAKMSIGRVCPYLIDLPSSELKGPLTQFQGVPATESGTLALMVAITEAFGSTLGSDVLRESFTKHWPKLRRVLTRLPEASEGTASSARLWPEVKTGASLATKLSTISLSQRRLFREILKSDNRLKPGIFKTFFRSKNRIGGDRSDGLYVHTLMQNLSLDRPDIIYRCKELEKEGLISSTQLTDICFRTTEPVIRLTNRWPKMILGALYSAQELANPPLEAFIGVVHYKNGHIDYRTDLDDVPLEGQFRITDTGLPGIYEFVNGRITRIINTEGKEVSPNDWPAWEIGD